MKRIEVILGLSNDGKTNKLIEMFVLDIVYIKSVVRR